MNKIERQLLYNQRAIMEILESMDKETLGYLQNRVAETTEILGDGEKTEQSACDMSNLDEMDKEEDALLDAFGGKTHE